LIHSAKRYERIWFERAFEAYLPPADTSIRQNADERGTSSVFLSVRENKSDGYEKCKKPNNDGPSDGLTDRNAPEGLREKKTTISARPVAVQDDLALPDFLDRRKSKLGQAPIGPGGDDDDLDHFTGGL